MKINNILYILFIFVFVLYSCHKDNNCPNVVPADFTISESCPSCDSPWTDYVSDTNSGFNVTCNALEDSVQYEWLIGAGIYTTQKVELDYQYAPNGYVIPITLIVHRDANTKCFDDKNNSDTLTKNLTINRTTHLYYGSWLGVYIDTTTNKPISDTEYVVTIKPEVETVVPYDTFPAIYGIQPLIDTMVSNPISRYKELLFQYYGISPNIYGRALVDSTNNNITILLEWANPTPPYPIIRKIFKGARQ